MKGVYDRFLLPIGLLPVGFRFSPNDEELVSYLEKKACGQEVPLNVFQDMDVFRSDPSLLPGGGNLFKDVKFGFHKTKRILLVNLPEQIAAAGSGYWRIEERTEEIVVSGNDKLIGIKNTYAFWKGNGILQTKTKWVMHEFRLVNHTNPTGLKVSEWAVYRVFEDKIMRERSSDDELSTNDDDDEMLSTFEDDDGDNDDASKVIKPSI